MTATEFFENGREYIPSYNVPKPMCSAWGYYTAALRGEAAKTYGMFTIFNWASTRPWSRDMQEMTLYGYCADIKGYLDTWFKK